MDSDASRAVAPPAAESPQAPATRLLAAVEQPGVRLVTFDLLDTLAIRRAAHAEHVAVLAHRHFAPGMPVLHAVAAERYHPTPTPQSPPYTAVEACADLADQFVDARQREADLRRSLSWRITTPLRWVLGRLCGESP